MIDVVYSDDSIIAAVKPVGLSSEEGMVSELKKQCECDVYTVHRLDTAVGGIMIYAKTKDAAAELSRQIQNGVFVKHYLAVTEGIPVEKCGIFEDLLFKDSRKNKTFVVKRIRKGVREAKLSYSVVSEYENYALVSVRLFTGRSHQIRVQFASRRLPLTGDGKYGAADSNCGIALFSSEIEFIHPQNKEKMSFSARPDFLSSPWRKVNIKNE